MKKFFCMLLVAIFSFLAGMPCSVAAVYAAGDFLEVGTDIQAGDYKLSLPDGETSTAVCIVEDGEAGEIISVDSSAGQASERVLTLSEGQTLLIVYSPADITQITDEDLADFVANDPYYTAVDGVDLHKAFSDAERIAESSDDYPLLVSVGYDYDDSLRTFSVSVRTLDDITPEVAKKYCADFIRLLNDTCVQQSSSVAPSSNASFGSLFDKYDCTVTVYRDSDAPNFSNPVVSYLIPAGTHGKYLVDMSGM